MTVIILHARFRVFKAVKFQVFRVKVEMKVGWSSETSVSYRNNT